MVDEGNAAPPVGGSAGVTRIARDVVDAILLELGRFGSRSYRVILLDALEAARTALDVLERSRPDEDEHLARHEAARVAVARAVDAVEAADVAEGESLRLRLGAVERSLERARQAALEALVRGQGERLEIERRGGAATVSGETTEAWRASVGEPRLASLDRAPLKTRIDRSIPRDFTGRIREDDDEVLSWIKGNDLESLLDRSLPRADEGSEEAATERGRHLELLLDGPAGDPASEAGLDGELAQLRGMARSCLDDKSATANLRRVAPHEPFDFAAMERFEQRMCDALDALLALATPFVMAGTAGAVHPGLDVLEEALVYGREAVTSDPGRGFARTFVLGSVSGEDTVRAALLALKQSPRYTHAAQVKALALAPNPAIDGALVALTEDRDVDMLRAALEALHGRGHGAIGTGSPLVLHADDGVRARAYGLLGLASDRAAAADLLEDCIETEASELAWVAAVEAQCLLGDARAVPHARARLHEELEEPGMVGGEGRQRLLMLLAVAGEERDHALLAAAPRGSPGESLALGYHGHVALAELLYAALSRPQDGLLLGERQRIAAAQALVRITGAPLLTEPGRRHEAKHDAVSWDAWWREFGRELPRPQRLRWGQPWSALAVVDELLEDQVPMHVRRASALELALVLDAPRVNVEAFVATQRRLLGRCRASVEAGIAEGSLRVGGWR